jgi:hypothetical protein
MNEREIKVEDYPAMARKMAADLRTGGMGVLANKMSVAHLFDSIATRLETLEQEALKPRSGAINLERERVMFHITAGAVDWNPTEAELQKIADQFKTAEFDTEGRAFIATRDGVNVHQITGNDFVSLPFARDE